MYLYKNISIVMLTTITRHSLNTICQQLKKTNKMQFKPRIMPCTVLCDSEIYL